MTSARRRHEASPQINGSIGCSREDVPAKTDLTRWRLRDDRGRQTWHYLEKDEELEQWPMTFADKYFLGMDTVSFIQANTECQRFPISLYTERKVGTTNVTEAQHSHAGLRKCHRVLLEAATPAR